MKRFGSMAVILAFVATPALAQLTESAQFWGRVTIDIRTGKVTIDKSGTGGGSPRFVGDIYNNTTLPTGPATANAGVSSTDLTAVWGDRMTTLGTGTLFEHEFSIFNSSTGNSGSLDQVIVDLGFFRYDGVNLPGVGGSTLMGSYQTDIIDFTGGGINPGLPPGYYSEIGFTGLDTLVPPIDMSQTSIYALQTIQAGNIAGGTTRLGIVSANPLLAGTTSPDSIYVAASSIGGGVPGMYLFGNPAIQANVIYRMNVVPEPATMALLGLGALAFARRRR